MQPVKDTYNFKAADTLVEFAIRNGQKIHGHNLIWHLNNPDWLEAGKFTDSEKLKILKDHVTTVVGHFANKYPGVVRSWDVVNEPLENSPDLVKANKYNGLRASVWASIGSSRMEYIRQAFLAAHEADPNAILYLNDYWVETKQEKSDALYNLVKDLKAQGVPIDVVGFQGHLTTTFEVPSVTDLRTTIRRFGGLGVKVQYTEVDSRTYSEDGITALEKSREVEVYKNFVEACVQEKTYCLGVTTWGFTNKYSWIPDTFPGYQAALPFTSKYLVTDIYSAIQNAALGK